MSLKALTESDRNVLYKNLRPCFFLTVVTTCIAYECTANIFSKAHVKLQRKVGKQSHKLTYYFFCLISWLFTIPVKSKVIFQCNPEIACPVVDSSMTWFLFAYEGFMFAAFF